MIWCIASIARQWNPLMRYKHTYNADNYPETKKHYEDGELKSTTEYTSYVKE